jgi:hypothetical protein
MLTTAFSDGADFGLDLENTEPSERCLRESAIESRINGSLCACIEESSGCRRCLPDVGKLWHWRRAVWGADRAAMRDSPRSYKPNIVSTQFIVKPDRKAHD